MTPLVVRAWIHGGIALPGGPLALDALLASQVALRAGLPPPRDAADCQPIEIPVQRAPGGRFYLASFSVMSINARDRRFINRRAPVEQYQTIGESKIRRVQITSGKNKSYRIPFEMSHAVDDVITWWCIGNADAIRELLTTALYLGKKRSVGMGRVERWGVDPCAIWDGFPVVRDGKPLRALPADWPGLDAPRTAFRTLSFPYWDHSAEVLCAIP